MCVEAEPAKLEGDYAPIIPAMILLKEGFDAEEEEVFLDECVPAALPLLERIVRPNSS